MSTKNGKRTQGRRFPADEKMKILKEARQPRTTLPEVPRRYQLDGTTFYRWERDAKAAMRDALVEKPRVREGGQGSGDRATGGRDGREEPDRCRGR